MTRDAITAAMRRLLELGESAAEARTATVDGAPLHYLEEGAGEEVVVLLHGGTGGGANWFRQIHSLSRRFRVLAPDLPGFGLSPRREPVAPLGVAAARLFEGWLRGVGVRRALVVGTSFGGIAALRLAQRAPDLVDRLLLLDAAGLGRDLHPALRLATLPLLDVFWARPTRRGTARTFRMLLTHGGAAIPRALQDALIEYLFLTARAAGRRYLLRTFRMFAGPAGQREFLSAAELTALPQPTSIVVGEHDPFFAHGTARRAAAVMPGGTFSMIQSAGHSPNWEAPDAVLAALLELAAR